MKRSCLIALFVMYGMFAMTAHAQTVVPNTFLPNTPAKAEEVNANFSTIVTALNQMVKQSNIYISTCLNTESCSCELYADIILGGGVTCAAGQEITIAIPNNRYDTIMPTWPPRVVYHPAYYQGKCNANTFPIKINVICAHVQ